MKRGVVFGAGGTGKHIYEMVKDLTEIVCFVDNDKTKQGGVVDGKEILSPDSLKELDVDIIYCGTLMGLDEIPLQLQSLGISLRKLDDHYVLTSVHARVFFLQRFAERVYKENLEGAVAEAGVYRGEFAKYINKCFADRECYLFDTFEGFTEYDIGKEQEESLTFANHLKNVNVEETLAKMPNRDNIILKIGRFPDTATDIPDQFCFVNLDMDLYQPTLEGLRLFYPRMVKGGIILVHDYFNKAYPNVEKAIDDFEAEAGLKLYKMPIGDDISMAIIKIG